MAPGRQQDHATTPPPARLPNERERLDASFPDFSKRELILYPGPCLVMAACLSVCLPVPRLPPGEVLFYLIIVCSELRQAGRWARAGAVCRLTV